MLLKMYCKRIKNIFNINIKLFKNLDISIIVLSVIISVIGGINILSATSQNYATKHFFWLAISLIAVIFIILVDYSIVINCAPILYWSTVLLLIATRFIGSEINGAKGWIRVGGVSIQAAEFAKLGIIIMLAKKLNHMNEGINNIKNFIILCIYAAIPMVLILVQPDMGMTMVCFFTVLGIFFMSGLNLKVILGGFGSLIISIMLVWNTSIMRPYWKARLISFLNPEKYVKDYGFQLYHSLIAIGSGGIFGVGWGNGVSFKTIPESHTDFIFAVIGEEWGLIGCIFLILLYSCLIIKFINIAKTAKDIFGKVVCIGITSSLMFSIIQNIGMNIGIMPITGIPLPLVSYGGSSMLTNFLGIGLVLSIGIRHNKINF